MRHYTVRCNFTASIDVDVMANDEGEALDKARDIAEDADAKQFTIHGERESQIIASD